MRPRKGGGVDNAKVEEGQMMAHPPPSMGGVAATDGGAVVRSQCMDLAHTWRYQQHCVLLSPQPEKAWGQDAWGTTQALLDGPARDGHGRLPKLKHAAPATMPTSVPEGTCKENKGGTQVNETHFPLLVTYY
jgi:hypothetical protein